MTEVQKRKKPALISLIDQSVWHTFVISITALDCNRNCVVVVYVFNPNHREEYKRGKESSETQVRSETPDRKIPISNWGGCKSQWLAFLMFRLNPNFSLWVFFFLIMLLLVINNCGANSWKKFICLKHFFSTAYARDRPKPSHICLGEKLTLPSPIHPFLCCPACRPQFLVAQNTCFHPVWHT